MKEIQWLSNEELYEEAIDIHSDGYGMSEKGHKRACALKAELERRLRLSGFFDMSLEFYLRELPEFEMCWNADQIECYSMANNVGFLGKTTLEAAKAAYEWKNKQK